MKNQCRVAWQLTSRAKDTIFGNKQCWHLGYHCCFSTPSPSGRGGRLIAAGMPLLQAVDPPQIFPMEFKLNWHVYIILCSDDTLYTGITTDVERRMRQHATGRGAKYFRGRQPKALLYLESGHDRSAASKRELSIKAMTRADKQALVIAATAAYSPLISSPAL